MNTKIPIETNIRMTKRDIENKRQEIESLKSDSLRVRSSRITDFIEKEIKSIEHMIERREFKLWKLMKEIKIT